MNCLEQLMAEWLKYQGTDKNSGVSRPGESSGRKGAGRHAHKSQFAMVVEFELLRSGRKQWAVAPAFLTIPTHIRRSSGLC